MEINALLLNFEKQLHISEHEKTILTGFLHFLVNRCNSQNVIIPYGLLIQYDEDSSYQTFLSILESVLPQLNTKDKYLLKHATEKSLSQITLKEYFKTPKEILVLTDCEDDGSLDSIISQFQSTPDIIKIVCAPIAFVPMSISFTVFWPAIFILKNYTPKKSPATFLIFSNKKVIQPLRIFQMN